MADKTCRCGRSSSGKNGQCAVCAGVIERGFCPDCFNDLHFDENEGVYECWICHNSYYLPEGKKYHEGLPQKGRLLEGGDVPGTQGASCDLASGKNAAVCHGSICGEGGSMGMTVSTRGPLLDDFMDQAEKQTQKEESDMPRGIKGSGKPKRPYARKKRGGGASPENAQSAPAEASAAQEASCILRVDVDLSRFPKLSSKLLDMCGGMLSPRELLELIVMKKLKEMEEGL